MSTPREALLSAANEDCSYAAMRTLGCAAAWTATVVGEAAACGDDAIALAALAELDAAFAELARLGELVPDLLQASFPGGLVDEQLTARTAQLARMTESVAAQRAILDELETTRAAHAQTIAAHQNLRKRLTQLRRLERLAGVLTDLAAQRQLIDARVVALTEPVEKAEEGLITGSEKLISLSAQWLEILQPQAQELLKRAETEQARLAAIQAEVSRQQAAISDAEARAAQLREMHESLTAGLRLHAEADLDVLDALSKLDQSADAVAGVGETEENRSRPADSDGLMMAKRLLTGIESQLAAIDATLARTLVMREPAPDASS